MLPNPAKSVAYLFYRMPWEETAQYSLYNTLGELITQQKIDGSLQLVEINTELLGQGLYYVKIQQGTNILYSSKLSVIK